MVIVTLPHFALLIVFDEETATGVIFLQESSMEDPFIQKSSGPERKGLFLVHDKSGSIWRGLTGQAVQGSLKGSRLEALPITPWIHQSSTLSSQFVALLVSAEFALLILRYRLLAGLFSVAGLRLLYASQRPIGRRTD